MFNRCLSRLTALFVTGCALALPSHAADLAPLNIPLGAYEVLDVLEGKTNDWCVDAQTLQLLTPQGWVKHYEDQGTRCEMLTPPSGDDTEFNWRARCVTQLGASKIEDTYKMRVLWMPGVQLVLNISSSQGSFAVTAKPHGACRTGMLPYRPWGPSARP